MGIVGPIKAPTPPKIPPVIETVDPVEQFYLDLFEQQEAIYPEYEQFLDDLQTIQLENGKPTLSGQWKSVNEHMSPYSRAYQKQITGHEGMAWVQNGVKFDGVRDGVLLDAKAKLAQFISKKTGDFYGWFKGRQGFLDSAARQIRASEGSKIEWYFAEESVRDLVQDLFMEHGITEIELIFDPPTF